jgi:hypothetical protein
MLLRSRTIEMEGAEGHPELVEGRAAGCRPMVRQAHHDKVVYRSQ